jgi:hypothetical protein
MLMASSAYQHLPLDVFCFVNALHPLVRPLGVQNPTRRSMRFEGECLSCHLQMMIPRNTIPPKSM